MSVPTTTVSVVTGPGPGPGLHAIAASLVTGVRGILAADESPTTMSTRLARAGIEPTEENRRAYRQMLVTSPGLSGSISGVILSDETFAACLDDGRAFPVACRELGILPGIKVDTGARPLAFTPGETITEGLDGLRERLARYVEAGAAFTKWRAVIAVDADRPTRRAVHANAHALARYAALAQEAGLVPIVEPEVLMDGDHPIERTAVVTAAVLGEVFTALADAGVDLAGIVLKPNMVVAGKDAPVQPSVGQVAAETVRVLTELVPGEVAGIAFLSGGQGPRLATEHLAAMHRLGPAPWPLSFSFGRALVDPALAAWGADAARWSAGQQALLRRAGFNAAARAGTYDPTQDVA
ncbi:MAG: class I fructose-bisphosphate aldolase [Actinomycetes bacterium]